MAGWRTRCPGDRAAGAMWPRPSCCWRETPAAASLQCQSGGCAGPNNPRRAPAKEGRQAWLHVTSRAVVATSRHSSHGEAAEASELCKEWETVTRPCSGLAAVWRTPSPHHGQHSPQHGSLVVSYVEGAVTGQSVPGGRRGGRAASRGRCCPLPAFLPPASAWSPVGDTQHG